MHTFKATANSNIALIKYWGKRDVALNLPAVGSISLTLEGLTTTTRVGFDGGLSADRLELNGRPADPPSLKRVSRFLDIIRDAAGIDQRAQVVSENNFPTAAGLASSASAFAALSAAAAAAAGLDMPLSKLSEWARRGSGSAARSIFGGFVEMHKGRLADGSDAIAEPLTDVPLTDLRLLIAITSEKAKKTGSTSGMGQSRDSSPYFPAWVDGAEKDLADMRDALRYGDFEKVGELSEFSCLKMHALALSGNPGLIYWNGVTVDLMHMVRRLRAEGMNCYFTIDAGPQVKVLCRVAEVDTLAQNLEQVPGVIRVIKTGPGAGIRVSREAI